MIQRLSGTRVFLKKTRMTRQMSTFAAYESIIWETTSALAGTFGLAPQRMIGK